MNNYKTRTTATLLVKKLLGASIGLVLAGVSVTSSAGEFGNGVNLQPSYYNNGNVNMGWSLMKSKGNIKSVRIEIEPGKETQGKTWIAQAKSNGYAVIATYHKSAVLGSDSTSELAAAGTWWKNNYNNLAAAGSIFVNISNEWGSHNISANSYASAYNSAISSVRSKYSGRIVIDIPGWGQETATAAAAIKGTNGTKINDTYIVPSIHAYPGAWNQGKNAWLAKSDVDDLGSAGRGVLIGEFGNGGSGSSDWSGIVDYAKGKGYNVLGWAWNGDGGSMNMVTPSWASNATATSFSTSSYFSVVYNKL
ncbi:MAG: glycoside hydrolase [Gammaproteobacteria bacterium]|nr:MAG: glycoside hydrolase [Gammaproteobacteria bacterium]